MSSRCGEGGVDFTLLFRNLGDLRPPANDDKLLDVVKAAALDPVDTWPDEHRKEWAEWSKRYWSRVEAEARPAEERRAAMGHVNPKCEARRGSDTPRCSLTLAALRQPLASLTLASSSRHCYRHPKE